MSATVEIETTLKSTWKTTEPFRPTEVCVYQLAKTTDLTNYATAVAAFADEVWTLITSERAASPVRELTYHMQVRIENTTHPTPAKGVVKLAKAHFNWHFTDLELTSATIIKDSITNVIADLKNIAKY